MKKLKDKKSIIKKLERLEKQLGKLTMPKEELKAFEIYGAIAILKWVLGYKKEK